MKHWFFSREDAHKWLTKPGRGVEFGEIWSVTASFTYAWRTVDVVQGRAVAPLTSKLFLISDGGLWFNLLLTNGLVVGLALAMGLATGNTYRIRSYVSLFSAVAWSLIAVAAGFANMPPSVAVGYWATCAVSWLTAVLLSALADMPTDKAHLPFLKRRFTAEKGI